MHVLEVHPRWQACAPVWTGLHLADGPDGLAVAVAGLPGDREANKADIKRYYESIKIADAAVMTSEDEDEDSGASKGDSGEKSGGDKSDSGEGKE